MNLKVLKINAKDNVAISLENLNRGDPIEIEGYKIKINEDILIGHKIAIKDLKTGDYILKYGHVIGTATNDISQGSLVHSHNLKTNLSNKISYAYNPLTNTNNNKPDVIPKFFGYRRKDRSVGIRNEIWIINTVGCINSTAEKIARICNEKFSRNNFDGVFTFSHPYGCSQLGGDLENTQKVLAGLIRNPNAGGILLLGLGCENVQVSELLKFVNGIDRNRMRFFNSQDVEDEIETGIQNIRELFGIMKKDHREEVPISELTIGMKCGGSDGFSGITANPLVGRISDLLTSFGAKVILSEVPEMFGAEQQLMDRAKDVNVFNQTVSMIDSFKKYFLIHNQPIYENPSPGNKDGGITTLEEKSLGAIQKGGESIITQVLDYGEHATEPGLILLKSPGNDGISSTAMVVSGANLLLFTTGRGTPFGFPVPTVKISSNTSLFEHKNNWIDFNAGLIIDGALDLDQLTNDLLQYIIDLASGKIKTKNELNGFKEIAIWKGGVTL